MGRIIRARVALAHICIKVISVICDTLRSKVPLAGCFMHHSSYISYDENTVDATFGRYNATSHARFPSVVVIEVAVLHHTCRLGMLTARGCCDVDYDFSYRDSGMELGGATRSRKCDNPGHKAIFNAHKRPVRNITYVLLHTDTS